MLPLESWCNELRLIGMRFTCSNKIVNLWGHMEGHHGQNKDLPQWYPCPVNAFSYMAKENSTEVIKLSILRQGNYSGSFEWGYRVPFKRDKRKQECQSGSGERFVNILSAGFERGVSHERKLTLLSSFQKERSPANTSSLAKWDPFQTSDLHNFTIINTCCFSPSYIVRIERKKILTICKTWWLMWYWWWKQMKLIMIHHCKLKNRRVVFPSTNIC